MQDNNGAEKSHPHSLGETKQPRSRQLLVTAEVFVKRAILDYTEN